MFNFCKIEISSIVQPIQKVANDAGRKIIERWVYTLDVGPQLTQRWADAPMNKTILMWNIMFKNCIDMFERFRNTIFVKRMLTL